MYSILHIDSSKIYRKILKEILEKYDKKYYSAEGIEGAWKRLNKNEINLIVMALNFIDGDEEKFIEELQKSKFSDIPIIIITSEDSLEIREKMFQLGVVDYINKKELSIERIEKYIKKIDLKKQNINEIQKRKIAVLDDSKLELKIIKNIFKINQICNVDYYISPSEFLKSEKKYDLYLIDLVMPKYSGEEIIFEIRKRSKTAIIIAISAIKNYKSISNILYAGANDYLIKPFAIEVFMARIDSSFKRLFLIEELQEKNSKLKKMVKTDGLTNLYNHKFIYEELTREIKKGIRYKEILSIIMFDIDHFKSVNDIHGHQMGDKVLKEVAKKIQETFRDIDIIGRYGGEEFLIILPKTNKENAFGVAERCRKEIEKISFNLVKKLKISISGGIKEWKDESALELVNRADKLLYLAKENGRNRIEGK